ncbi:MAG: inositol monophosphatase [Actinobacteria bacterium]|nr:inositol monophosphatase [Actinomycetota bacterium]
MTDEELLAVLRSAAGAVGEALERTTDWGPSGAQPGQYLSDVAADRAAREVLQAAGLAVLSEESGHSDGKVDVTVVLDPLDGSTNASRRLSWWATSLCAVDADGPRVALVVDLVSGRRYEAVRGRGATRDGARIAPSAEERLGEAMVGINGMPERPLGWLQFRALGAAALDLCAVADGRLDGYVDCTDDGLAPWDYLGGALVCSEAGAVVTDLRGRELLDLDHGARRTVVAGATAALADALGAARRASPAR